MNPAESDGQFLGLSTVSIVWITPLLALASDGSLIDWKFYPDMISGVYGAIPANNDGVLMVGSGPGALRFLSVDATGAIATAGELNATMSQQAFIADATGAPVISGKEGGDAAGIVYDGVKQATAQGIDCLIVDTAGRLQNKSHLMEELSKIRRVLGRLNPEAPHDVLLVLDATTGQNALAQVEVFRETAGVTGLIMTKLDGTAKGGILVALAARHPLPVHFIGVGEGEADLQPFDAAAFAQALTGTA